MLRRLAPTYRAKRDVEVSPLRRLRIAAPSQLSLVPADREEVDQGGLWAALPEAAQAKVLRLFARLIARGVIAGEADR